jgi:sporulation integral membrane protein YlbJ
MKLLSRRLQSQFKTLFLGMFALLFAVTLVFYPEIAFQASLRGLKIWWDVVFPAMLPFFITAELLIGFGVVHLFGIFLEPLMRPLFRVPGSGGFVMAVSLISGNPMGAKLATRLREQKLVTREEGERLISFTCTAGPLFIFGAVAIGFFENASVGILLAVAHYVSCFLVAFIMRFHEPSGKVTPPHSQDGSIFTRAFRAIHYARVNDGRPIGQILGEAVTSAVQTLLMIGGFIIIFSVLIHVFTYVGITTIVSTLVSPLLHMLQLSGQLAVPIVAGILEMTLGSQMISEHSTNSTLLVQLAFVSLFLGWNGLSIHAQVASVISKSDIRYRPYLFGRVLHGILAFILTFLLWKPFQPYMKELPALDSSWSSNLQTHIPNWWIFLQLLASLILIGWIIEQLWSIIRKHPRITT